MASIMLSPQALRQASPDQIVACANLADREEVSLLHVTAGMLGANDKQNLSFRQDLKDGQPTYGWVEQNGVVHV